MNILIIYCHPSNQSYTFQILEQLKKELALRNWNTEVSDLYAINFQSDLTEEEYQREGLAQAQLLPADILTEQKKIEKADGIIFLYPVWWGDCPAKLKGWFDRVYTAGYAHGSIEKVTPMKLIKYGLVICTAGHPNELLTETGIAQSMKNIMLNDRLGKRFESKEMLIPGGTLQKELVKELHNEKIKEVVMLMTDSLNI